MERGEGSGIFVALAMASEHGFCCAVVLLIIYSWPTSLLTNV